MRLTLKAINAELAKQGHQAMLEKGDGYFYFRSGEAVDWLDRTVTVPTVSSLTLDQWMQAFRDLQKKNAEIGGRESRQVGGPKASGVRANKKRIAVRFLAWASGRVCPPSTTALGFGTAYR